MRRCGVECEGRRDGGGGVAAMAVEGVSVVMVAVQGVEAAVKEAESTPTGTKLEESAPAEAPPPQIPSPRPEVNPTNRRQRSIDKTIARRPPNPEQAREDIALHRCATEDQFFDRD
ncbi:hypothetical protein Bca52824_077458 [Brassica carinata]|uniref:Uncharacterized protein n=1 Tax=Brassica carinata TaxID=52824 RepID=A0A8X7TY83_BRACI|nr:hypothetical protein Bca52824_077458 [Brassica carinata]